MDFERVAVEISKYQLEFNDVKIDKPAKPLPDFVHIYRWKAMIRTESK